ncbi:unnamed protein product [Trifolium pratense]|uniref:Uncharacterized protein n=1 Tax=Trifolium pratense TaxID=57577 RepID=A0ACB0IXC4_TRIPR|nr:unnamed protein product [Trifolium pratense]
MNTKVKKVYDDLICVRYGRGGLNYQVRVIRKWKNYDRKKPDQISSVGMVLIDKYGHKIEATIPVELVHVFDPMITEGVVYDMTFLSVNSNMSDVMTTFHKYKFDFNLITQVESVECYRIPSHGLLLINSKNVLRDTFQCELSGDLVDVFRKLLKNICVGLPIVVLQFAKINEVQGVWVVFGCGPWLVLCLNKVRTSLQINDHVAMPAYSTALDFKNEYSIISVDQLKTNPDLGIFILNVRIGGIVDLYPWWYPICGCHKIIETYIGAFFYQKCDAADFCVAPKHRFRMVVEDESGSTYVTAYDHVLHSVAGLKTNNLDFYMNAVKSILGKSVLFVVEKTSHEPRDTEAAYELLSVTANDGIVQRFVDQGFGNAPSKNFPRDYSRNCLKKFVINVYLVDSSTGKVFKSPSFTSTTNDEDLFIYSGWKKFVKEKKLKFRDKLIFRFEDRNNVLDVQIIRRGYSR